MNENTKGEIKVILEDLVRKSIKNPSAFRIEVSVEQALIEIDNLIGYRLKDESTPKKETRKQEPKEVKYKYIK
jgi:hypothetical protein